MKNNHIFLANLGIVTYLGAFGIWLVMLLNFESMAINHFIGSFCFIIALCLMTIKFEIEAGNIKLQKLFENFWKDGYNKEGF